MATAEKTHPVGSAWPGLQPAPGTRWLPLWVAAFAMVATLPGRTHGLGLITEPLIANLGIDRVSFALINTWATLLGAAFCLPCGWLLDRVGTRAVLVGVALGLAFSVLGMAQAEPNWGAYLLPGMFVLILLTRGLGQSSLSVVSLALMGRSVGKSSSIGVGVYSFITAVGFMAAFATIKRVMEGWEPDWRTLWSGIGVAVGVFALVALATLPSDRRRTAGAGAEPQPGPGLTPGAALGTPAFWTFAGATSFYGMIASGISLFNQSILAERGFDRRVFLTITALSPLVGLAANLATGAISRRVGPGPLMAVAMLLLLVDLVSFPLVTSLWQVYAYAVAMGIVGGMVTVIFFGVWGQLFGLTHLGKIQGAAQMLTVLASAVGPLLLAWGQQITGSYVPVFQYAALMAGFFALTAFFVPAPRMNSPEGEGVDR